MGLQVTKTAAVGGRENSRLCWSFLSGGAGLVCSSPVLRWVFPCETASASTAPFQLPQLLHVSLSLPLSVLKQTKDGGGWVDGRGVSWNTEGSLSGIFSYGFLQACILKTLCYNIFSYSTQLRSWEGTVGPTLFSSAHFLFFFFFKHIFPPCTAEEHELKPCCRLRWCRTTECGWFQKHEGSLKPTADVRFKHCVDF